MNRRGGIPAAAVSSTRRRHHGWRLQGLALGVLVLMLLGVASVFVGSRPIPARVTLEALLHFDPASTEHLLVHHLRIPRALLAILVGAALGAAGVLMQAMTRNPLADPGILGVNAGATLAIVSAIAFLGVTSVTAYMWFGLLGAAMAGGAVYLLGGIRGGMNPVRVVLAGSALTVVLLALTQIITVNSDEQVFDQYRHWFVGSLQGRGHEVLQPVSLLIATGLLASLWLAKALDAVALGGDLSRALGTSARIVWMGSALTIVLLGGGATAAAGPISFVGLTAPHVARAIVGTDHRRVLPCAMLVSATLVVGADLLGRLVVRPGEVGVGIMAALIGGPFFVFLVQRWQMARP